MALLRSTNQTHRYLPVLQAALTTVDAKARLELVNQLTDYVSDALAEVSECNSQLPLAPSVCG